MRDFEETVGRWRGVLAAAMLAASVFLLAACDGISMPSFDMDFITVEEDDPRLPPPTSLRFAIDVLEGGSSLLEQRLYEDVGLLERRRLWRGPPPDSASASLIVTRRLDGGELPEAGDPKFAVGHWKALALKTTVFDALYESENALGPVRWRRFTVAGNACVILQQGWGAEPEVTTRLITGYYCQPPGVELTPGQAETVVRAVTLWDGG